MMDQDIRTMGALVTHYICWVETDFGIKMEIPQFHGWMNDD